MRIFGAIFILISGLIAAKNCLSLMTRRIRSLESICRALEVCKSELSTSLIPLPQLCDMLSERIKGEGGSFFSCLCECLENLGEEDFSALWEKSAITAFPCLKEDELKPLVSLGEVLGRYELPLQINALDGVISELRTGLNKAKASYFSQRKLCCGVCISFSSLIVLWLL